MKFNYVIASSYGAKFNVRAKLQMRTYHICALFDLIISYRFANFNIKKLLDNLSVISVEQVAYQEITTSFFLNNIIDLAVFPIQGEIQFYTNYII
jgi:hypothetical protein